MGSTQLKDTDEVCEVIVINDIICALIYKEDSVAFFSGEMNEGACVAKRNLATG
jgi:hypothetical protein